ELRHRARPAMSQDQRQGIRLGRQDVQEVHVGPIDSGGELREAVQLRLVPPPVVAVAPVGGQLLQVAHRHTAGPVTAGQLAGPAGTGEAVAQVVEIRFRYLDLERPDLGAGTIGAGHRVVPSSYGWRNPEPYDNMLS